MRITGYKRVVVLVLAGGIAFWLWHATRPPSPGAATSAPQASAGPAAGSPAAVSVTAPAGATAPAAAAGDQPPGPAVSTTAPSPSPALPVTPATASASPSPAVPVTAGAAPAGEGGEMAALQRDLGNLQFVLRDFRLALGGNPVGSNAEIVKALLGRNKKKLVMKLWEGHRLNADGELIDPWGTPYFFHQVSAEVMELRCAGPDRVMWNKDDINVQ